MPLRDLRRFLFNRLAMTHPFQLAGLVATLALAPAVFAGASANAPFPVSITVDAGKPVGELTPLWRFFGADEPNYACMKDGRKLLSELGRAGRAAGVFSRASSADQRRRFPYALKWGSTSAYKEDADGRPLYDWTINDQIFDAYLAARDQSRMWRSASCRRR
jgi:xylan 1,4-beta-xylosidase